MANIKSQIKRNRQNVARRRQNRSIRSELLTRSKNALATNSEFEVSSAMKQIDKAGNKRVIHPNAASRRKSRLQKRLNNLGS